MNTFQGVCLSDTTLAKRRNYSINQSLCVLFSPLSENWFNLERHRDNKNIYTSFGYITSPLTSSLPPLSFTFDGSDLPATWTFLSPCWCVRLFLPQTPKHKPASALFQIEWRQIMLRWHRCVSIIIISGHTNHRLLPQPPLSQIISRCYLCRLPAEYVDLKSMSPPTLREM